MGEGMTDLELKPCPFCGAPQQMRCGHSHHYIVCTGCGAKTRRYQDEQDAVRRWNGRADE